MRRLARTCSLIALLGGIIGCSSPSETTTGDEVGVLFDEASGRIHVTLPRELGSSETLHARVRRGGIGALSCANEAASIPRIDGNRGDAEKVFLGPEVDQTAFETVYDDSWIEGEPTAEMLATIAEGGHILDLCWMSGSTVVREVEVDVRQALDRPGTEGKYDDSETTAIRSVAAYADFCVSELGEIPFFPKITAGDYETYNCLDSTEIPTTVTAANGTVSKPTTQVNQCDNPQYIYDLCEPNAIDGQSNGPRVARRDNDKGTSWVLLCRKAKPTEGVYNDIAMIGHNPFTGRTCFFQNALYQKTDGLKVPHPGDRKASTRSPQKSESLWDGIHGGLGHGIQCAKCHDADPFVHTPWIDQARMPDGTAVVPKMGEHPNFPLGYNDAPYSIMNTAGQRWTMPQQITGPEVAACTRCHRMGDNQWSKLWLKRLNGTDTAWTNITTPAYRKFEHAFWMPPDQQGLDATSFGTSEYGFAIQKLLTCGASPSGCTISPLPFAPITEGGALPQINLTGLGLAKAGLAVFGADINDPSCVGGNCRSRRCAECHAVSRTGLRHWAELTRAAKEVCKIDKDPNSLSQAEALATVNCMRVAPSDPTSVFEAAKLGIYTTGVQYGHFQRLFKKAYGDESWLIEYARFKARVSMPKGSHPALSEREHAILLKWFAADLAKLDEALPEAPPPQSCTAALDTTAINAHLSDMEFEGWGAINAEADIRMYGCSTADPLACLTSATDKTSTWGNSTGKVRQLREYGFRTSYWTRSSADGRFVGNGGGTAGATISDLELNRDIGVDASYDPGFFPDNKAFIFQGGGGGAGICNQSLLETDTSIDFSEASCIRASGINLYQHVARGIGGSGDYFIINSQFTSDPGQSGGTDPLASFDATSTMKFTPMVNSGNAFVPEEAVIVESPYEGDSVLSPSMRLVASRLAGPNGKSLGYVIRKVNATRSNGRYNITIDTKVATICGAGAKPNFSFDERFMVTHVYDGTKSNIVLIDLKNGSRTTITNVPANVHALFPHFRSDGWIYFTVKTGDKEYLAASDAAIRAGN